jgi:hypothetical protein
LGKRRRLLGEVRRDGKSDERVRRNALKKLRDVGLEPGRHLWSRIHSIRGGRARAKETGRVRVNA